MRTPKMLKVVYNGEFLKNIYPHANRFQVFKYKLAIIVRRVIITSIAVGVVVGSFSLGKATTEPLKVYADKEVIVEVDAKSPVMDRIAQCESKNKHIAPSGQVVINVNSNGTYDIGLYQINSIWNSKATQLGYNLYVEKDNRAFALYLYKNYGTEPWSASRQCWNK